MHEQQNGMHYTALAEADRIEFELNRIRYLIDSGFVAHTNHVCSHTRSISAIIKSNITRLCRFAMYHLRTYACSFVALWPAIAIAHSVNDKTFEYLISICLCYYAAGAAGGGAVSYFYFICLFSCVLIYAIEIWYNNDVHHNTCSLFGVVWRMHVSLHN